MKPLFRRDFLRLGVGGFAGLAVTDGLAAALPFDIGSILKPSPLGFDFVLSVMARSRSGEFDLGGVLQPGIRTKNSRVLSWTHDIPSYLLRNYRQESPETTTSYFDLQTKIDEAGSELRLDKLTIRPQENKVFSISLGENLNIGELPNAFSFERNVGGVSFDFLGVVGESKIGSERALLTPIQYRTGPLFYDSGWRSLPYGYKFRIKGPEAHPLRPCRYQDTWHYNVEIKRNGRWVANHHYGAYKENRKVCLLYYESRGGTCRRLCTPRVPKYSEVYNFAHKAVDQGFRKLGVVLPYVAVAVIAYILASLFFAAGGLAFAI